jgi:hypothetical protein
VKDALIIFVALSLHRRRRDKNRKSDFGFSRIEMSSEFAAPVSLVLGIYRVNSSMCEPSANLEFGSVIANESLNGTTPMSKNAIKKAAKAARLATLKLERRAREKEAKKEKRRVKAEKRAAGELDDIEEEEIKRHIKKPKLQFGGTVVIDLGFDSMMNDKASDITPSL